MANRLQHLRGSESEHSTFTGAKGEISLVTDTSANRIPTGEVRVHDGTTAGGLPLALGTTSKPLTNNIVLGSGVGINFNNYGSEDSNSATTVGNNLLDDYEIGSWTPTVIGTSSAGSGTYLAQNGRYTKIGNVVTATAYLNWTAHTGSGNMKFAGLPFTVLNAHNVFYSVSFGLVRNVTLTASNLMTGYAVFNQTTIDVEQYPIGGGNSTPVALDTSAEIMYTITYFSND